jgi:hypothetical protein
MWIRVFTDEDPPHGAEGPTLNIDCNGKNTRWTLNNQELKSK